MEYNKLGSAVLREIFHFPAFAAPVSFSGSFGCQLYKSLTFFHRKLMETSMKMEWQRKPFCFLLLPNLCEFDLWRGIKSFVYGWNSTVAKVMFWFLLVTRTCVLHKHIPSHNASREKWINRVEIKFGKSSKSYITMSFRNDFSMPLMTTDVWNWRMETKAIKRW